MSTKRKRVPPAGGGRRRAPRVGSAPLSTRAGLASVLQTSWKTVPGMASMATTVDGRESGSGGAGAHDVQTQDAWGWKEVDQAGSKMATARVQPAEAPRILCGKQLMVKPCGGSASSWCSFSRWQ